MAKLLIGVLAGIALLVTACDGGDDAPITSTATATSIQPPSPTPTATREPVTEREPTVAPDGRTGIAELDAVIELLLTANESELQNRFASVPAWAGAPQEVPVTEWGPSFAEAGARLLYAVLEEPRGSSIYPARTHNVIVVAGSGDERRGWRFGVDDGEVVDVYATADPDVGVLFQNPSYAYDQFLVLPPREDLPTPPLSHDLSTRTAEADVDAVLDLVGAGDADDLLARARFDEDGMFFAEECSGQAVEWDRSRLASWLRALNTSAVGIYAIAVAPDGYRPASGHLVMFVSQVAPYDWQVETVLVARGELAGVIFGCEGAPNPPSAVILPEPAPDEEPAADRRSGIEVVDRFVDAVRADDIDTLAALIDYDEVACIPESQGIGSPPICREDEAVGTPIRAVTMSSCEGYYVRADEIDESLRNIATNDGVIYAVYDLGATDEHVRGSIHAVMAYPSSFEAGGEAGLGLRFSDVGVTAVRWGCGPSTPHAELPRGLDPVYLLAPR